MSDWNAGGMDFSANMRADSSIMDQVMNRTSDEMAGKPVEEIVPVLTRRFDEALPGLISAKQIPSLAEMVSKGEWTK